MDIYIHIYIPSKYNKLINESSKQALEQIINRTMKELLIKQNKKIKLKCIGFRMRVWFILILRWLKGEGERKLEIDVICDKVI